MSSSIKYPQTGQSLSTGNAWSNPSNILADDGTMATVSTTGLSAQLTGTNYSFAIPTTATINGIVFEFERNNTGGVTTTADSTIQLKKSSGAVGDNKSVGATWPTTQTAASYGGASELWGTTWTPAEINNNTFGVFVVINKPDAGDAQVDYFKLTVYYTLPGGALFFQQI